MQELLTGQAGPLTSSEFTEWIAYRKIVGPLCEQLRGDYRIGKAIAVWLNANQDKHTFEPADFFAYLAEPEDEEDAVMSHQEQVEYLRKLNAMMGGTEVKR